MTAPRCRCWRPTSRVHDDDCPVRREQERTARRLLATVKLPRRSECGHGSGCFIEILAGFILVYIALHLEAVIAFLDRLIAP